MNNSMPFRGWINQPSTLQPLHKHHGKKVLVTDNPYSPNTYCVYFVSGASISMIVPKACISKGWNE